MEQISDSSIMYKNIKLLDSCVLKLDMYPSWCLLQTICTIIMEQPKKYTTTQYMENISMLVTSYFPMSDFKAVTFQTQSGNIPMNYYVTYQQLLIEKYLLIHFLYQYLKLNMN